MKQQFFSERLSTLLEEKGMSQGEFAEKLNCSRQSVNFYILGKRNPDIVLAAEMADILGVSCDYLLGRSDIRKDRLSAIPVGEIGMTDESMKFFAGLQILSSRQKGKKWAGVFEAEREDALLSSKRAEETLKLLNNMIAHEKFGVLLQYIKRYRDILHGEDALTLLENFLPELRSPETGKISGGKEENWEMMKEFCLHVVLKYFDEIVRDITKT